MKNNNRIKIIRLTALLCAFCMLMTAVPGRVCAAQQTQAESSADSKGVVRIGFSESEEYGFFAQFLLCMARKMVDEGSIRKDFLEKYKDVNFEESFQEGNTLTLWNDICDANVEGAGYQFTREAFFDMSKMKESEYGTMANREDVDLIFAMGTAPGVYLVAHEKRNKVVSVYAADPVASGILKSETDRFIPNSYAMVDYTAYRRQLEAGFKFLHFKKLGIVFEDSEEGYLVAAIPDVESKAKELGFEIVYENVKEPVDEADEERYYKDLKAAWRRLIDQGIDCLYITISSIDYETQLMDLLNDAILPAGIKTLAQDDFLPLEYGVLFGVTLSDTEEIASHIFEEIEHWHKEGAPFDELDMNCESTPRIGVNYTTAQKIGFDISFEELQIVDKVFRNDD